MVWRSCSLLSILLCLSCNREINNDFQWQTYSADAAGSKYAPLNQIDTTNVGQLKLAWTYTCGDYRQAPASTIQCNPIIIDGIAYITTPGLKVVALDAATGTERWKFDPYEGQSGSGVNRGVTYWSSGDDRRIFYVAGAWLYALDAATGLPIPSFGQGGKVDLYEGLGRELRHTWVTAATPGIIFQDLLILGSTLGEGPGAAAPGHLRAFDVHTGDQRWIFHTIPYPGEAGYDTWPTDAWQRTGGANAWGGFTLDAARGWVFCGTGSATFDHYGGDRPGANLFANCILALDAATGKRVWHYQVVHHDIWDYDLPCPPNLVQISKEGQLIDAVAQATKMGHLFVLNRETGEPLFPVQELPVPPSTLPGEQSWPTQPMPHEGFRYARQVFTTAEATDLNPEANQAIRERLAGMRTGSIFLPPGLDSSVIMPQFNGGTDWGGAAFDPVQRMLYVNSSNEPEWIAMRPAAPEANISVHDFGRQLFQTTCSNCHGYDAPRNPGAPTLKVLRAIAQSRSILQLDSVLQNGKGQMPTFASLTDDERQALIAYVRDEGKNVQLDRQKLQLSFSQHLPYVAIGHPVMKDPEGFPASLRPWGMLNAVDLDRGRLAWQVPLGTYPELEKRGLPPTGTFNMGGPAVTAGGLVFIGASMDSRFRAFHHSTGAVLWEYQLDAGAYATPAVYEVNGKQYILIAAGGGGKPETAPGDKYYCFSL